MQESTFPSSVARDPMARSLVSSVNRSVTEGRWDQTVEMVQSDYHLFPIASHCLTQTRFQIPDRWADGVPLETS